jgi:hypothetical protein
MGNFVAGLMGIVLLVAWLGFIAYDVNSLPLWIGIIAGLILAIADFVQSLRKGIQ